MKTFLPTTVRVAALATILFLLPAIQAATPADRAATLLAGRGAIPVHAAGPHVAVGTYQIQVTVKLGRPNARLADGTWLYENFAADNSAARGTLVVRFDRGRVISLALATPAVVAAFRNFPRSDVAGALFAAQNGR